tara:strand:- start:658 stop:1134 length:477 start_codon:yes stop_codon:yes gene_type:complete
MSLVESIKKLAIRLTGTQARVSVIPRHFVLNEPLEVSVAVEVHEEEFEIRSAYLLIRGVRESTIIDADKDGKPGPPRVKREEFFQQKVDFLDYKLFKAREKHSYTLKFELDDGIREFSNEAGNKVYYELLAGLDVLGNDPGSSWVLVSQEIKQQRRLR